MKKGYTTKPLDFRLKLCAKHLRKLLLSLQTLRKDFMKIKYLAMIVGAINIQI